ncbi:YbjN domain-containing protein [Microlunatus sp. Gsoil 973]|uniref:T3SS (YopN, CesT) and YbjN peptide-binding chaperone 1 n=1 Tax=Microlunatus sp. Gsoil 973 TaxID=2672569 RepID=UPI00351B0B19
MDATDYEGFDIDRSTEQAWAEFRTRLSEVISVIDETADLVIGTESERTENGGPFVSFSAPARDMIRSEAASNAVLGGAFQLGDRQLAAMEKAGWNPPSADASPNFWIELAQEESDQLADLAVTALRDVYGVQHPVFLAPDQLAEILTPKVEDPAAERIFDDDDVAAVLPGSREHLDDLVAAELTELFGHRPIRDDEGDIAIRVGSTMIFLRTTDDAQEIVIFAAIVHDVEGRSRAVEVLNDLNVEARWVKFQLIRDRVFATLSVVAQPFVPAHLAHAVQIMSDTADGIDDELAEKLRGRTTFGDGDDPA